MSTSGFYLQYSVFGIQAMFLFGFRFQRFTVKLSHFTSLSSLATNLLFHSYTHECTNLMENQREEKKLYKLLLILLAPSHNVEYIELKCCWFSSMLWLHFESFSATRKKTNHNNNLYSKGWKLFALFFHFVVRLQQEGRFSEYVLLDFYAMCALH